MKFLVRETFLIKKKLKKKSVLTIFFNFLLFIFFNGISPDCNIFESPECLIKILKYLYISYTYILVIRIKI
jgi:hypothetical protein